MPISVYATRVNAAETFRFFHYWFDIDLVRKHIEAQDVKFEKTQINIVSWATQMLGLDRNRPDRKPAALLMKIDYDHLDSITPQRLKEPIFVVETKDGGLVIDGNHRLAKAYMNGIDELPALVFPRSEVTKLGKPVKTRRNTKVA